MSDKESKKELIKLKLLERESEAKTVRKIVLITVLSIVLLFLALGVGGYFYINSALKPANPTNKKATTVNIPIGSSVSNIASILENNGIIKDARIFKYYIKFKNESGFQAGKYNFSPSMKLDQIISSLKTGKVMQNAAFKVTIPEGKQLVQISEIIAGKTGQNKDIIFKQLNDKNFVKKMQTEFPNLLTQEIYNPKIKYPLEGYLYPATYSFNEKNPSLETIIVQMLKKSDEVLSEYRDTMIEKKMSTHKLLTVASLIEEEATQKTHREAIASVFYNRLQKGMPLQTDPTVLYAKGNHEKRVLYKDLEINSPYNTYKYKGLPPGPIANAGKSSIEAALNPAKTDFLYFLATADGDVLFSKTLEEHNKKKATHISK